MPAVVDAADSARGAVDDGASPVSVGAGVGAGEDTCVVVVPVPVSVGSLGLCEWCLPACPERSNLRGLWHSLERLVCDRLVCDVSDGLFVPSCVREGAGWNDWFVHAVCSVPSVARGGVKRVVARDGVGHAAHSDWIRSFRGLSGLDPLIS